MSRLRELRLHGFKTFAEPTRFVFEPGVNAIIGPNGSGKSNMADAVRWVLGEQSNRSLRTRRADDVIFAGSQQRQPQGMAEAVLILDNADGWLPIDFAEVSIGRRAYRSGESEYLINGARARLRDVVELLGEGRLGANELVVVGQGTVDAALSLRPEERRQLFEEAAGVKGLQVRKNEALGRLARARDNLTRIGDLIAELKPQVRRLSAQAEHQQEHDGLLLRARSLVSESHRRRERAARSALGEARRRAAAAEAALDSLRAEQQAAAARQQAAEERYWQAEAAARAAAEARETTREALIRAESRSESIARRSAELRAAIDLGERELMAAREAHARLVDTAPVGIPDVLDRSADAERVWRAAIDKLAAADAELLVAEDALAEARRDSAERLVAEARRRETLAAAVARRERLESDLLLRSEAVAHNRAALQTARETLTEAEAAAQAALERMLAADAALHRAQQEADSARRRHAELVAQAEASRAELSALHGRTQGGERLVELLAASGWSTLLDVLAAPQEAWPAIEALVGGELGDALLWRDGSADPLDAGRGVARLLAPGSAPSGRVADAERQAALRSVGATRTLAEWVGAAEAPAIFHRTVVATELPALLRGWRQLPTGWSAVTEQGDLADARGMLSLRGRSEPPGGSAAHAHARRRELEEQVESLAAEESQSEAAAAHAAAHVERLRGDLADARREHEVNEAAVRRARADAEQAAARADADERAVADLEAQLRDARLAEADARAPSAATVTTPADAEVDRLAGVAAHARELRDAAAATRDAARAAWLQARAAAEAAETSSAGQRRELSLIEARIAQHETALPAQRIALQAAQEEAAASAKLLAAARSDDEAAAEARAAADAERERLRAELLALERGSGAVGSRLAELERDAQASAVEASRQEEALGALERERQLALESLPQADRPTTAQQPADGGDAQLSEMDEASLEAELRRVRRTLGQIGSVNPFAVEEHRELAARLDDLSTQESDVRAAIDSTEELLRRLDAEIAVKFNLAFAAIGDRFDEFCRLLFAGGSAALQMSEGDDGEAPGGIEIVVRPPGKRPQRLAMLSGGERALTGVALLFAMLTVNPVPFCILDEVDAALDEANIGRFAEALRKLSQTIDFVVITHNRATMEVADTIYGVTMTDAAVSHILSLRLADLPVEVGV